MMYFLFLNMIFCFQLPIVINGLIYFKYINLNLIIKNRKVFYFILFNLSALISPPEILNQIGMVEYGSDQYVQLNQELEKIM